MRKSGITLEEIAEQIKSLRGESVKMSITKGRRKSEKFSGEIVNVYPSIFTIKVDNPIAQNMLSYSYNEVLCGDVKITKNSKK
ncbi:MAG: Veg family protein [Clostridia bacterium]|nr:Veg family protein [Clostridia bacterium]